MSPKNHTEWIQCMMRQLTEYKYAVFFLDKMLPFEDNTL